MDYGKLVTTIVSGVLALALIASVTVLLASGQTVPDYLPPLLAVAFGAAVGSARAAS